MKNEKNEQLALIKKHKCHEGWVEYYSHFSFSTQTLMKFSVFRPSLGSRKKVPGLFWLSGLTCTEENFMVKAEAQKWAEALGLMIICPDTSPRGTNLPGEHDSYDFGSGASFYLNALTPGYRDHYQMENYIAEELPLLLEKNHDLFPLDSSRLGIFGHSMGGHGALVLGLRHPHRFRSLSAFAPICAPTQCPWGQKAFQGYLGEDRQLWEKYDATEILKNISFSQNFTPLFIDQGTEDEFLKEQLRPDLLLSAAQTKNYPLTFRYQEGYDHSYFFIATFIRDHLQFHARQLA